MAEHTHKGIILKQAREAKGISLRTIHEATKIPMDALRAIEEGYTVRTLSSFYHKGFTKMYAKYLGVDVSKVIDDYHPEKLPKPIAEREKIDVSFKIGGFFTPSRIQSVLRILIIIVMVFAFVKIAGCLVHKVKGISKKATRASTEKDVSKVKPAERKKMSLIGTKTKKKALKEEPKAQSAQRPVVSESIPASDVATSKRINLSVRAKKSSWLQVKVDGTVVFQSVFKRGTVETWSADKSIELAGRNIHELEFELNGKMIGSLGRGDRRARKVVVTKSGLKVK